MSEQINQHISAFIDGELDDQHAAELVTIISQNKSHEDTLHRYAAIRDALHPAESTKYSCDLVSSVRDAIQREEDSSGDFSQESNPITS